MGGPEDPVHDSVLGVFVEVGVDVLPDNATLWSDLEHPAEHALRDQRIAIGQPAGSGDVSAKEVVGRIIEVFPNDMIGLGVHLNYPGEGKWVMVAVGAVVVNKDVSVGQQTGGVLLR